MSPKSFAVATPENSPRWAELAVSVSWSAVELIANLSIITKRRARQSSHQSCSLLQLTANKAQRPLRQFWYLLTREPETPNCRDRRRWNWQGSDPAGQAGH